MKVLLNFMLRQPLCRKPCKATEIQSGVGMIKRLWLYCEHDRNDIAEIFDERVPLWCGG